MARDLKPSDEFNISQQHTELRLLSSDIDKLHIDETKPVGDNQPKTKEPQRIELDEDEENPLGSDENPGEVQVSETTQVSDMQNMEQTKVDNGDANVANNETSDKPPAQDEELETKESATEEPGDEDEFEGGLC